MTTTIKKQSTTTDVRPGYKHTPLGWIPEDWENRVIGDIIDFSGGSQPPQSTFVFEPKDGYVRLIQTRDYRTNKYPTYVPKKLAKKFCDENDIMIGRYGPPIFQIFSGLKGAYNVALIKAMPNTKIVDKKYSFYFLSRIDLRMYLESLSQRSGGQTGVEMDRLKEYPFPLPPLHEQRKIAAILSTWDDAIQTTQQLIAQLQQRNKGLAQQLLTGKKRLKGFEGAWKHKPIANVAKYISLKNTAGDDLIVLSCTKYNGLVPSLEYFGRRVFGEDTSTYKVVPRNHFAYATNHINEGSIGYQYDYDEALISPMYTVFKVDDRMADNFLFKLLKSHDYVHEYNRRTEGSINRRGGLRWKEFSKITIPVIDIKEQKAIAAVLDKADEELKAQEAYLAALQRQKKGLMQQLLTGAVRVKVEKN